MTKYALTIETVLVRPLFLISLVFALLLLPAVAFAAGDSSADTGSSGSESSSSSDSSGGGTSSDSGGSGGGSSVGSGSSAGGLQNQADDSGETFTDGSCDNPAVFDQGPAVSSESSAITTADPDHSVEVSDQGTASEVDNSETAFSAETPSLDSENPDFTPPRR